MGIVYVVSKQPSFNSRSRRGAARISFQTYLWFIFCKFYGVNNGLSLNASLYQTNWMQEFFFEVGLQHILFRNHPVPPPQKINGLLYTKKMITDYLLPMIYEIKEWLHLITSTSHLKTLLAFKTYNNNFYSKAASDDCYNTF